MAYFGVDEPAATDLGRGDGGTPCHHDDGTPRKKNKLLAIRLKASSNARKRPALEMDELAMGADVGTV